MNDILRATWLVQLFETNNIQLFQNMYRYNKS